VFVPQNIEGVVDGFGVMEEQVPELRLAISVEADDLTIEYAAAALQVAS
jgi:hypothetical protein